MHRRVAAQSTPYRRAPLTRARDSPAAPRPSPAPAYASAPLPPLSAPVADVCGAGGDGGTPPWLAGSPPPHDIRPAASLDSHSSSLSARRRSRAGGAAGEGTDRRRPAAKRHRSSLSDADLPARALARLIAPLAAEGGSHAGPARSVGSADTLGPLPPSTAHRRKQGVVGLEGWVTQLVAAAVSTQDGSGGGASASPADATSGRAVPDSPSPREALAELKELLVADPHPAGRALAEALERVPRALARGPSAAHAQLHGPTLARLFRLTGTYLPRPVRVEAVLAMLEAALLQALPPEAVHAAERAIHALALADRLVAPRVVPAACDALVHLAADGSADAVARVALVATLISTHLRLCDPAHFHALRPRALAALGQAMESANAEAAEVATTHLANLGPAFYACGDPEFSRRVRAVLTSRRSLWRDPHVAGLAAELERVFLGGRSNGDDQE